MKKHFYCLVVIAMVHSNLVSVVAQYGHTITPDGISHVLKPGYSRIKADTVYYITHLPNPTDKKLYNWDENREAPLITGYTVQKHSKDNYTDTLFIYNGLERIDIKRHDDKQRTVCVETDYPPCKIPESQCWEGWVNFEYFYHKEEIEYDSKNRISKVTWKAVGSVSGKDSITGMDLYDYSTIKMTDKGYIYGDYEYELDALNRVTYLKALNNPDVFYEPNEYFELNGKKYRVGDFYYTYFDGWITLLQYEKTSMYAKWKKIDYFFHENGMLQNIYYSFDGETWDAWEKKEVRYAYTSVATQNSNPNVYPWNNYATTVYGIFGIICINTDKDAKVSIYNSAGRKISQHFVHTGVTQIRVSEKGLYLVTVNDKSYKVIVN